MSICEDKLIINTIKKAEIVVDNLTKRNPVKHKEFKLEIIDTEIDLESIEKYSKRRKRHEL